MSQSPLLMVKSGKLDLSTPNFSTLYFYTRLFKDLTDWTYILFTDVQIWGKQKHSKWCRNITVHKLTLMNWVPKDVMCKFYLIYRSFLSTSWHKDIKIFVPVLLWFFYFFFTKKSLKAHFSSSSSMFIKHSRVSARSPFGGGKKCALKVRKLQLSTWKACMAAFVLFVLCYYDTMYWV